MLGITDYLWRLIPGNPILLRVVEGGGRRKRDLFIRCGYLGLLVLIASWLLLIKSGGGGGDLTKLAQTSAQMFVTMSYLQLALVALLSPIFTAGAITQEKDSQTYDILLATPLTNAQIVLGSLLSRAFFIVALLISGIPIFSITQIFGGVAIRAIVSSFAIAAATAFVTGALAMAIATFKVGTRRTIFSFYLFIVIYLVGGYLLDSVEFFHPLLVGGSAGERGHTSWFTGIHPFLALRVIFNQAEFAPPGVEELPAALRVWPLGWYFSSPHTFFISFMFFLTFVLVMPSIMLLRRLAQSTNTLRGWILQKLHLSTGDRTRKPRAVWSNPIAWREGKTKGSAARAVVLRWGFTIAGLGGAVVLLVMSSSERDVQQFITAHSYDADQGVLTVYAAGGSGDGGATTVRVNNRSTVTYTPSTAAAEVTAGPGSFTAAGEGLTRTGNADLLDSLRGRYAVESMQMSGGLKPYVTALKLRDPPRLLAPSEARNWLLGSAVLEFAVILLVVTNAAASTVTREKEDGTLDLLLSTPITSRYYIWGKLRGLVHFVLPLVAVPVASILLFVVVDLWRLFTGGSGGGGNFEWVVLPEALLSIPGTLVISAAFASIVGMQMSLRCRTTVMAVMSSIGIVVGACFGLGACGLAAAQSNMGQFGLVVGSFSPFTLLALLVNPYRYARAWEANPGDWGGNRLLTFVFAWVAAGGYTAIVWAMYKSMVKNFDMTIRRQSR